MWNRLHVYVEIVAVALMLARTVFADNLVTENYPPFTRVDPNGGAMTGLSVEMVAELMRRSHDPVKLES